MSDWWRSGVIYQVYPRSFQDSTGDGVGDLRGILSRLDYLVGLGITAVWVSPFYPSPMADFGYDVSNYTDVDPLFGTLSDFDALLGGCHARGLKLILDFVPNHTSDQHPWFVESRSSKASAKRDWYLWRDAPNNWMSNFGGPAWTFDEDSGQYYYHSFLKEQPDLNWHNPAVRQAISGAMRFWLDKGIDGFRMDVLWLLIKDDQFRDNLPNPEYTGGSSFWSVLPTYTADQPETHAIVREMRALLDEYGERVLIGEIYLPVKELVAYYGGAKLDGAQMPFNFHLIQSAWQADVIADLIREYEAALPVGAWPNWVLGNHDQHRLATRLGAAQARVAAVLLLTLRGTPTMYAGDELGMPDAVIGPEQVVDPAEKNQPGMGLGRDPERSPMVWDWTNEGGFTTGQAWLPMVWDWGRYAAAAEAEDAGSMLNLYRALLALRGREAALRDGDITEVAATGGVLRYRRGGRFEVHLNMTAEARSTTCAAGRMVLNSFMDQAHLEVGGVLRLRANEAVVVGISVR